MIPKIESLLLLAKFEDGIVRQVITTEEDQIYILSTIANNNKSIRVVEDEVNGIDWESKFKLTDKL